MGGTKDFRTTDGVFGLVMRRRTSDLVAIEEER